MANDILHHDNGVVDNQTDGCCQSAQGHDVKTHLEEVHKKDSNDNRKWNIQRSD